MVKKKFTPADIKKMTTSVERVELPDTFEDESGNIHNIDNDIELAEKHIDKIKQAKHLHMRWYPEEIERCKRIARAKGFSGYQTYVKTVLKQAMDRDEKELG